MKRKWKHKITPQKFQEIVEKYQNGQRLSQLAAEYSTTSQNLSEHFKRKGIATRKRGWSSIPQSVTSDLVKSYLEDERVSARDLADKHNLNYRTICRALKKRGVEIRRSKRKLSDKQVLDVVQLYKTGSYSLSALAEKYSVSWYTIKNYLIRNGIPMRGKWSNTKENQANEQ